VQQFLLAATPLKAGYPAKLKWMTPLILPTLLRVWKPLTLLKAKKQLSLKTPQSLRAKSMSMK
jgi:hypothetical protein